MVQYWLLLILGVVLILCWIVSAFLCALSRIWTPDLPIDSLIVWNQTMNWVSMGSILLSMAAIWGLLLISRLRPSPPRQPSEPKRTKPVSLRKSLFGWALFLSVIVVFYPLPPNVREVNQGFEVGGRGGWHDVPKREAQAKAWYGLCWTACLGAWPFLILGSALVQAATFKPTHRPDP
jgi:hypothetical protein